MKKIIIIMVLIIGLFSCGNKEKIDNNIDKNYDISILIKKLEGCKGEQDEKGNFCSKIGIIQKYLDEGNFNINILKQIVDSKKIDENILTKSIFYYIGSKYDKKTNKLPENIKNELNNALKSKVIKPYLLGTVYSKGKQCYNDEGSLFHLFIIMNDVNQVKFLLDNNLFDLKIKYCYQDYPILQFLKPEKKESLKMFELLLKYGANPNDENIMGYSTIRRIKNLYDFTKDKEEKENIKKIINILEKNNTIKINHKK